MRNLPVVAGSFATLSAATTLIAACGGSANSASTLAPASSAPRSVATTPRPTPKPSPSPTVWTTAQAGKKYLAMVAPGNAQINVYRKMTSDTMTLQQAQAEVRVLAKVDDDLARALSRGLWPASVLPKIDAFVEALAEDRATLMSASYATTTYDVFTQANTTANKATAKAEAVRIALNVPPTS